MHKEAPLPPFMVSGFATAIGALELAKLDTQIKSDVVVVV